MLETRLRAQKPTRREMDKVAARTHMLERSGSSGGLRSDWRQPVAHAKLLEQFRPAASDLLGPMSHANGKSRSTPPSEASANYTPPNQESARNLYRQAKDDSTRLSCAARASNAVRHSLDTPFYGDSGTSSGVKTDAPLNSGFRTRSELVYARKHGDFKRAQGTFGSAEAQGFGSDFRCGRRSLIEKIANINSIVD